MPMTLSARRFLWLAAAVAVIAALVLLWTGDAAGAQVATDGDSSPDSTLGSVVTVNNFLVLLITGLVIPLVTGLLAREDNPAWVKLGLAAAVTAVATLFLNAVQDDGTAALSQEWFAQAGIVFVTALASYARVWRPLTADAGKTPNTLVTSGGIIPITRHSTTQHDVAA